MKKFFEILMEKFQKDERGMTLVELLAVVVILAIVGVIAFVSIGNVVENSKKDAHVANAQQLISAAKLAEASGLTIDSNGVSPAEGTEFNTMEPIVDPWTKTEYTSKQMENTKVSKDTDGDYLVSLPTLDGENENCTISNVPESAISQGRSKACDYSQ